MHKVTQYDGKHRIERPMNEDGWTARDQIESAKRGVPNESPRHGQDDDQ